MAKTPKMPKAAPPHKAMPAPNTQVRPKAKPPAKPTRGKSY